MPPRARVSITEYGAVGDGVTDCAAAFQAAARCGRQVDIPAGRWLLKRKLQWDGDGYHIPVLDGMTYEGAGESTEIISGEAGGNVFYTRGRDVTVANLAITCTSVNHDGVKAVGAAGVRVLGVRVLGGLAGIQLIGVDGALVADCELLSNAQYRQPSSRGLSILSQMSWMTTRNVAVVNVRMAGHETGLLALREPRGGRFEQVTLIGVTAEDCLADGISVQYVSVDGRGLTSRRNGRDGIYLAYAESVRLTGVRTALNRRLGVYALGARDCELRGVQGGNAAGAVAEGPTYDNVPSRNNVYLLNPVKPGTSDPTEDDEDSTARGFDR